MERKGQSLLYKKITWQTYLSAAVIFVTGILLIVRACYGMDTTDETFYLATARRFSDGDLLFKHDWNTAQVMGLVLLPLYRFYVFWNGSSEGIILFSRILFVLLEVFTASFLFRILKRVTGNCGTALLCALCALLYVRGNIINLSYYSLGMHTFLLAVLWWIQFETGSRRRGFLVLSGISFSISVLCMPYMAVCFFLIAAAGIFRRNKEVFWFSCGVFAAAAGFLCIFGRWIPWEGLWEYIPLMFQDPEMDQDGVFKRLWELFLYYINVFLRFTWPLYIFTVTASFIAGRGILKTKQRKERTYLAWLLLAEFFIQSVYVRTFFESGIIITFLLLAVQLQLLYPECREEELETYFLVPGIAFGLVWVIGSNVGHRVANMSFLMLDIWGIHLVRRLFQKQRTAMRICGHMPAYLLLAVLGIIRFFDVYRDGVVSELSSRVSSGVMAGIYTEAQRADTYERIVEVLRTETADTDTLAVLGCNPWVYMDSPGRCGSYITWTIHSEKTVLNKYYERFPEKVPNVILLLPPELGAYTSWRFSSHGAGRHVEEQPELEGILKQIVEEEGYVRTEKNGVVIYRQKEINQYD
ncbi:MAG: hypothetical protein K1W25_07275 [Lachnospiraceae bacterium]